MQTFAHDGVKSNRVGRKVTGDFLEVATLLVYTNGVMARIERTVNKCDVCGHEWLSVEGARRCARCKSPRWNWKAGLAVAAKKFKEAVGDEKVIEFTKYEAVKHHPTCKCLMCRPEKE